ncbi:hypothetical protein ACET3Z_007042 [Daucus carota]
MDEKEESEAMSKWDCPLNSCLYDTYDVVAIGNQLDSFIMKFPFFGSSRRLPSLSTTSVSNAASGEFPTIILMSEKRKFSMKVSSLVSRVWGKIVRKYVGKKSLKSLSKESVMKGEKKSNIFERITVARNQYYTQRLSTFK